MAEYAASFSWIRKTAQGCSSICSSMFSFFSLKNIHYIVNLVVIVFFQGLDTWSHTMFHAVLEPTTLSWGAPNSKQPFYRSLLNIDITITGIPHHDCLNSHSLKKECSEVLSTIICSPCGVQLHKMIHSYIYIWSCVNIAMIKIQNLRKMSSFCCFVANHLQAASPANEWPISHQHSFAFQVQHVRWLIITTCLLSECSYT